MIADGRVTCNGVVCKLGDTAEPMTDIILVDGKTVSEPVDHVYIMLNKPRGFVVTLSDEKGRRNVAQLVADCGVRVYPVGRLDMDSEGLLFLTNDGAFAHHLMHPRHVVDKVYNVRVDGFTNSGLQHLREPIILDGYRIRTPNVQVSRVDANGNALLEITIHEGRNRQIRRMCAAAGMRVLRLKRVMESNIPLGDLPVGKWRYLTPDEIRSLRG